MACPTFIDITEEEQMAELREFLHRKGEKITKEYEKEGGNLCDNLMEIMDASRNIVNEASDTVQEYESLLYSLVSLVVYVPFPDNDLLKIEKFCEVLSNPENQKPGKHCESRLRVLQTLYKSLSTNGPQRYIVYKAMLGIAMAIPNMSAIITDVKKLGKLFEEWNVGVEEQRELYMIIQKGWLKVNLPNRAMKTMLAYLSTFEAEDSKKATKEAEKCIFILINDPRYFLMDHLLNLEPVKALKGSLIFELLQIFIHQRVAQYLDFYSKNQEFIEMMKLNHERNLKKMRILTLMQIGEFNRVVDFSTLERELKLESDQVENFVIEATACRAVNVKIDEMNKKIVINSTLPRAFEMKQWLNLQNQLKNWKWQLNTVKNFLAVKKEKPKKSNQSRYAPER
ncbi:DgyrCDS4595 [Dimorphilus gyrociliatus]|uniref:Eukaryotic translation initiation factor 3 subunit M n=1 Tax=Dimorphilus gyrociliatus TaxID=2664684 RepID=A0A7I8VHH6_9ANNE|nr:DgyrCDS4595 [Dimorphilus gyrociliatus]